MDYFSEADPLISSAIYPGVIDFDPYSRTSLHLEDPHNDLNMHLDSPDSIETYESEMDLAFHDNQSVTSAASAVDDISDSVSNIHHKVDDDFIEADRRLVNERFAPYDMFPADNTWTLEERVEKLLQLSPCTKYTKEDLLGIDAIESPEKKVDMLIEVVSKVHVNHRWNYVEPHELHRGYTVVANCKKEKKKDADGQSCPKRPMNAFMIWSMKCRALIAQVTPQLHNAIISTKLGAAWRQFHDEEKAVYEREKEILSSFHKFEFPNYKYKPKKKAKRNDEKPVVEPKQAKCLKRKRSESSNQLAPLRGINISDARQSLDPLLKERLQVKMQVKIDPDMKKGIGKRLTAIDLADLTAFHQHELTSTQALANTQQRFHGTPSAVHLVIDNKPASVFDTPENSPNKPVTPVTPTELSLGNEHGLYVRSDRCFSFDDKSSRAVSMDDCDNMHRVQAHDRYIKHEPYEQPCIKSEPNKWNINLSIKTEPQEYLGLYSTQHVFKCEPDHMARTVLIEGNMPVLSAETVESVLDNECTSSFNNEELLDDFMKYLDNDICFAADLLPGVTQTLEGPATV